MKLILTTLTLLFMLPLYGQDVKEVRKTIDRKKVRNVIPVEGSNSLYHFTSKTDTGIWNHQSKEVFVLNVDSIVPSEARETWKKFHHEDGILLVDLHSNKILLDMAKEFKLVNSIDSAVVWIVSNELHGFIRTETGTAHVIEPQKQQDDTIHYYGSEIDLPMAYYDPVENAFVTGEGIVVDGYAIDTETGFYRFDHLTVDGKGHAPTRVWNLMTLEEVPIEEDAYVQLCPTGWVVRKYPTHQFLDRSGQVIHSPRKMDEFDLETFQAILGEDVTEVEYLYDEWIASNFYPEGHYLITKNDQQGFFSVRKGRMTTSYYDHLYEAGVRYPKGPPNVFVGINDGKLGILTYDSDVLPARYRHIEQRAFLDGTHFWVADDTLFDLRGEMMMEEVGPSLWDPWMVDQSVLIRYIEDLEDRIVLSLRAIEPDVHDFSYGTHTLFRRGSGYLLKSGDRYIDRLKKHTYQPWKDYYLTLSPTSSYNNYIGATLYDKEFKKIDMPEYNGGWIYQGKLIVEDEKYRPGWFDPKTKKFHRIGDKSVYDHDFRYRDGYLFLGMSRYFRDGTLDRFETSAIITPELEVIYAPEGTTLRKYIGNGLFIIGKNPNLDPNESHTAREEAPIGYSVYDMFSGETLSPYLVRVSSYIFSEDEISVQYYDEEGEYQNEKIPLSEVREKLPWIIGGVEPPKRE